MPAAVSARDRSQCIEMTPTLPVPPVRGTVMRVQALAMA